MYENSCMLFILSIEQVLILFYSEMMLNVIDFKKRFEEADRDKSNSITAEGKKNVMNFLFNC